jgi:hypothetical protein
MALGGIPYYLNYIEPGRSAVENIQAVFFDAKAPLQDEFKKLFTSLTPVNLRAYFYTTLKPAKNRLHVSHQVLGQI